MRKVVVICLLFFIFSSSVFVCAHQPRLIYDKSNVHETVYNPEVSQAFYGELKGKSDFYVINSSSDFELYVNILSPDVIDARKDFVVSVYSDSGNFSFENLSEGWKLFYEEFGGDNYWRGPELDKNVSSGNYVIEVTNPENLGRYSLAVGKIESFSFGESLSSVYAILRLKHDFFDKSYFAFFEGIIGKAVGVLILVIALIVFGVILIFKRFKRKK